MNRKDIFVYGILAYLLISLGVTYGQDTTQKIIPNRNNAPQQQEKPYVILISADGFRYDYLQKYHAQELKRLAKQGVKAEALIPSFPSITFPNHYTIVTGLYPAHHGLIGNNMIDPFSNSRYSLGNKKAVTNPIWYGGIPIWTLAEQQGMLSACFYWPGSEAAIGGILPSYYYAYNEKIPIATRIQTVVNWLSLPPAKRPHFITFYLPEVDHIGHLFGPDAPETEKAVHFIDSAVYALNQAVAKTELPVNFVFVSDHGMTSIDTLHPLKLPITIDTNEVQVSDNGTIVNLYVKNKKKIKTIYKAVHTDDGRYQAYLKNKVPSRYHFSKKEDVHHRIGDIVLLAKSPYYFSRNKPHPGGHGYDPDETPEMKVTFIAWGPAFKKDMCIPAFENIHIYPLLVELLGLVNNQKIDGDKRLLKEVLLR
ncbi:ectonucleotide pyrophosphatase/phosphodiesterase [Olivibacter ginsenosidimutans]|uniref:Ectonucleotide pyrophosphatase/phosphodiesterase n=1 Tax=Olivibacter ginsenosidimutans TaxID=1176537 RepID=A0ABP9BET3_9SPHI